MLNGCNSIEALTGACRKAASLLAGAWAACTGRLYDWTGPGISVLLYSPITDWIAMMYTGNDTRMVQVAP